MRKNTKNLWNCEKELDWVTRRGRVWVFFTQKPQPMRKGHKGQIESTYKAPAIASISASVKVERPDMAGCPPFIAALI